MGITVNPKFVEASNVLMAAQYNLSRAQNKVEASPDKTESAEVVQDMRKAEKFFHLAEKNWCNLPGLVEDQRSNMTEDEAMREVDKIRGQVLSYYA